MASVPNAPEDVDERDIVEDYAQTGLETTSDKAVPRRFRSPIPANCREKNLGYRPEERAAETLTIRRNNEFFRATMTVCPAVARPSRPEEIGKCETFGNWCFLAPRIFVPSRQTLEAFAIVNNEIC